MIRKASAMTIERRERMCGGNGVVTIQHLFNKQEFQAPVRLCARLTLPPGAGIGLHEHAAEDEVYVILKGMGVLTQGDVSENVGPGDAVLTGKGASHAIANTGPDPLELIAFIACYDQPSS